MRLTKFLFQFGQYVNLIFRACHFRMRFSARSLALSAGNTWDVSPDKSASVLGSSRTCRRLIPTGIDVSLRPGPVDLKLGDDA